MELDDFQSHYKSLVGKVATGGGILVLFSLWLFHPFLLVTPTWELANKTWDAFDVVSLDPGPWVCCFLASLIVAFAGILPLLVFNPEDILNKGNKRVGAAFLHFAVGGLLGDVFLHLLPEAWHIVVSRQKERDVSSLRLSLGLWILFGILSFFILEAIMKMTSSNDEEGGDENVSQCNGHCHMEILPVDSCWREIQQQEASKGGRNQREETKGGRALVDNNNVGEAEVPRKKNVTGYLNLVANAVDNFAHGLALGGSFLASTKVGLLTTLAILIHEIPHEVGDFAILLRSGFTRWEATKGQLATASVGLIGSFTAIFVEESDALERTWWILPFTAGGFLSVALVNVVPDLLSSPKPSRSMRACLLEECRNISSLLLGIALMAGLTALHDVTV